MLPFVWVPRRKRQDVVRSQGHSQGFRHCFLRQSGNNNQARNSRWRLPYLQLTDLLPLCSQAWVERTEALRAFLSGAGRKRRLQPPSPQNCTQTLRRYLAHHLAWQSSWTVSSSFPGESFITATLQDFGLNILYKCHKAEEHIKLKLHKPKQSFMEEKKAKWSHAFHKSGSFSARNHEVFVSIFYLSDTHIIKWLQLRWHIKFNLKDIQVKM